MKEKRNLLVTVTVTDLNDSTTERAFRHIRSSLELNEILELTKGLINTANFDPPTSKTFFRTIQYTNFGKVKEVRAEMFNMTEHETHETVLYVSRPEDIYALSSPQFSGKRVAVVRSEDWQSEEEI